MVTSLVLDVSTTLSFLLKDEFSPYAVRAIENLRTASSVFVPGHFWLEVSNALLMAERRNRASSAEISRAFQLVFGLRVSTDDETARRCQFDTLGLARQYKLTVYDAAYLELAMRRRSTLATVDKALARAAVAAGVDLLA
jgi:predicted nucleic acid-binding protein